MSKATVSKQQLGVTALLNMLAAIFAALFDSGHEVYVVGNGTTKRTVTWVSISMSLGLSVVLLGLVYVLVSWALDSGRWLAYGLTVIASILTLRCLGLTVKLWKKLP